MCPKPEAGENGMWALVLGVEMIGGAMLLLGFGADLCSSVGWVREVREDGILVAPHTATQYRAAVRSRPNATNLWLLHCDEVAFWQQGQKRQHYRRKMCL